MQGEPSCSTPIDRFEALDASALLDTPPEPEFDEVTRLAARLLHTPVALMSLVDRERQFFKSAVGLPEPWATKRETPLSHSFCQYVAASGDPLIVNDARTHDLVKDNLAIPDLGVVAYLGMPIQAADGSTLGALCAIDGKSREWTEEEIEILRALAAQINNEIGLRALAQKRGRELAAARQADETHKAMARAAAHDLRTPLNAMILGMQTLRYLGELNSEQRECIALCLRNGKAVVALINDLIDISMVERFGAAALNRVPCSPKNLAAAAVEQVASLAHGHHIEIPVKADEHLPMVDGDSRKLTRVLVNLLDNAIRFTPPDGTVSLQIRTANDAVIFEVSDTGTGIAKSDLEHIFEEGVSGDGSRSSGIGLAFCKTVTEAHGGTISVKSEPSEGSVFTIILPAAAA